MSGRCRSWRRRMLLRKASSIQESNMVRLMRCNFRCENDVNRMGRWSRRSVEYADLWAIFAFQSFVWKNWHAYELTRGLRRVESGADERICKLRKSSCPLDIQRDKMLVVWAGWHPQIPLVETLRLLFRVFKLWSQDFLMKTLPPVVHAECSLWDLTMCLALAYSWEFVWVRCSEMYTPGDPGVRISRRVFVAARTESLIRLVVKPTTSGLCFAIPWAFCVRRQYLLLWPGDSMCCCKCRRILGSSSLVQVIPGDAFLLVSCLKAFSWSPCMTRLFCLVLFFTSSS
jgi:hypothetical protein